MFLLNKVFSASSENEPMYYGITPAYIMISRDIIDKYTSKVRNDAFQKDLLVCSLRLLPVGGYWVVQAIGSIDRRFLLGGRSQQFFNCLKLVLFKTRSRKPFYLIRLVDRYWYVGPCGNKKN